MSPRPAVRNGTGGGRDGRRPRLGRLRKGARTVAIVAVPLGLLVAAALVARHLWRGVGDTAIGAGGLVILVVGG